MSDRAAETVEFEVPVPNADLRELDVLVGEWRVSGGAVGTVRYAWMEGGFFLVQHVDLVQFGMSIQGMEVIGHLRPFGEDEEPQIRSRFFDAMGNTLDYVYEPLADGGITIWAGEKGSPAFCTNVVSADHNTIESVWTYPDGGGYTSTMVRGAGD